MDSLQFLDELLKPLTTKLTFPHSEIYSFCETMRFNNKKNFSVNITQLDRHRQLV